MPKPIITKKGSSLYDATFSLATVAIVSIDRGVHAGMDGYGLRALRLDLSERSKFDAFISEAKNSEKIVVTNTPKPGQAWIKAEYSCCVKYIHKFTDETDEVVDFAIYTADVDKIRALAKELRTDKAVAKASKMPAKPKAILKTRRDII
ncbi:MAG: hypothetical protein CFE44_06435 [Burkholderiales bacterium PBB4]|nr:MAG: hypothetical protein CFE44_06435 [Burkholderiales bacterium PBB4]